MTTFPSDGSPSPVPNKRVMIYRESGSNGEEGREVQLADLTFEPLDYEVLANAKLDQPMVIPLAGRGTIIGGDVGPTEIGQIGSFRAELQSRFASKSIGLVKGGWLPSAIALEDNSIVLPDRCVVAELDRRLRGGVAKNGTRGDFIDRSRTAQYASTPRCSLSKVTPRNTRRQNLHNEVSMRRRENCVRRSQKPS